ncbi:hypothetical protein FOZ60_016765 [Perkinsus olseni]|uniref:Peptidase A1 domain-containing protein n=1 Tax=Perkinsus olseni TaxID=32597 RepID=A0A7J6N3G4_PEROL|nr:hypothetical protein FOZ60_016765 [Perkinsus olseni]
MNFAHYFWLAAALLHLVGSQVVKIDISREPEGIHHSVVAKLKVDNDEVYPVVDTGTHYLFFIWKNWFEGVHKGDCSKILAGCYECPSGPCKGGPKTKVTFGDGTRVSLFKEEGKLQHDTGTTPIEFGLTANYASPDQSAQPHASLGLARNPKPGIGYLSIVEQLLSKKVIGSSAFSLYLKRGDHSTGQVILGGTDPSLYKAPLLFLAVDGRDFAGLDSFGIGGPSFPSFPVGDQVKLDTGTQGILVPGVALINIIPNIAARASRTVEIKSSGPRLFKIACSDRQYLPDMTFFLKGEHGENVPLVFKPDDYVEPPTQPGQTDCDLIIQRDDFGEWLIGYPMLFGRYFYFEWDAHKIAFADLV